MLSPYYCPRPSLASSSKSGLRTPQRALKKMNFKSSLLALILVCFALPALAQAKRKVIIDQDARGPATTDQQSILVFVQSPEVETLGITGVSGDRSEEHTSELPS